MEDMNKKIVFAAGTSWDIHWMFNVIRAIDGSVYTTNSEVVGVCNHLKIPIVTDLSMFKIVVLTNIHLGVRQSADCFLNSGGKVILLQHAWDTSLLLRDRFWNHDMSRFTYTFVGCTQDYDWLSAKYGQNRVMLTGIPKLDDLYRIKNSTDSLQPLYEELGVGSFYLSIAPTDVISMGIFREYDERLESNSPIPIVFKVHPGANFKATKNADISRGRINRLLIDDDIYDIDKTYKIMKASSGVVCIESFFSIEASLLGKPVIYLGLNDIPGDFYSKDENINQTHRAPRDMSSSLQKPIYTEKQKEIAGYYLFDGQNTARVVNKLKEIL